MTFRASVGLVGFLGEETAETLDDARDVPDVADNGSGTSHNPTHNLTQEPDPQPSVEPETPPAPTVATVSVTPIAELPRKRRRGFLVSLDGTLECCKCGERGHIPHHLSLIFWQFWTREQLSVVLEQMRPRERLAWLGHRVVRLQPADDISDASARYLREHDGVWVESSNHNR